jgi:molybdate/tungstate transport system permease protein
MNRSLGPQSFEIQPFNLVFAALGGLVLLFIIAPLASLFLGGPIVKIAETAAEADVRDSIWLTLWVSMVATILSSVAAVPFSYLLARKDFPLKRLITGIIDLPVVIPHSAAGIAVLGVMSRESLVGRTADSLGFTLINSHGGIMAAMAFVSLPFLINAA